MINKIKDKKFLIDGEFLSNLLQDQNQHIEHSFESFSSFIDVLKDSDGYLYNMNNLNKINKVFRDAVYLSLDDNKIEVPKPIYSSIVNELLSNGVSYQKLPHAYGNLIEVDKIDDSFKDFESLFYSHDNKEPNGANSYNQDALKLAHNNFKLFFSIKDILKSKFSSLLSKKTTKSSSAYLPNVLFDNMLQPSKNYYSYDMHLYGYDTKFGFNKDDNFNDKEFRLLIKKLTFYTDWAKYVIEKNNLSLPNIYFFGATNIKRQWLTFRQIVRLKNKFIQQVHSFSTEMNHESITFLSDLIKQNKVFFHFLSPADKGVDMHGNAILNDYAMSSWDVRAGLFMDTYDLPKKKRKDLDNLFFDKQSENQIFTHSTKALQDFHFKSFFKRDHIYTKYLKRLNNVIENNTSLYPIHGLSCNDCKKPHIKCIHKKENKNFEKK